MSPQDKIIHVANKLGLSSLKDMQGSTGAVYDVDIEGSGLIFNNASQHAQPASSPPASQPASQPSPASQPASQASRQTSQAKRSHAEPSEPASKHSQAKPS